jgi:hypothetical protein
MARTLALVIGTAIVCFAIAAATGFGASSKPRTVILRDEGDAAVVPDLDLRCSYVGQFGTLPPSLLCGQWVRRHVAGTTVFLPLGVAVRFGNSRVTIEHWGRGGFDHDIARVKR